MILDHRGGLNVVTRPLREGGRRSETEKMMEAESERKRSGYTVPPVLKMQEGNAGGI